MTIKPKDVPLTMWARVFLCRQGGVVKAFYYAPGNAPGQFGAQVPETTYTVPMSVLPPFVLSQASVVWMAADAVRTVQIDGVGSIEPSTLAGNVTFGRGKDTGYSLWLTTLEARINDINDLLGSSLWKFVNAQQQERLLKQLELAMPEAYGSVSASTPVGHLKHGTWQGSPPAPAPLQSSPRRVALARRSTTLTDAS